MYDIWEVGEKACGSNCSALGTWRCQTPIVKAKLAEYGISNPYRDMVDNPNVLLLCISGTHLNRVLTHIQDHYEASAVAVNIDTIGDFAVYRIVTND